MLSVILYHFILFLIIHEFQDRKREFRLRRNDKFVGRCQGGEDGKKESKSRLTCFFFLRPAFINLFTGVGSKRKAVPARRIEFLLPRGGRILL